MIARLSLAALLLLGDSSRADAQRPPRSELDLLTITANRLPSGCRLNPADPPPTPAAQNNVVVGSTPVFQGAADFGANPWKGSDRETVARVRLTVDGTPELPDGPPLDRRQLAQFQLRLAEHVAEAYKATYLSTDDTGIDVFAVRFDSETMAATPVVSQTSSRLITRRLVLGRNVVRVSTRARSACFDAVFDYIAALPPGARR